MPEVKFIAAIDDKRGIARKQKIPWHIPADQKYFKGKLSGGPVAMGYKTYISNGRKPYSEYENFVFTNDPVSLGKLTVVNDLHGFFNHLDMDIWVAGGGQIFKESLQYATELYITRVYGDFDCDVFFPEFEQDFQLVKQGDLQGENGYKFRFELWKPNLTQQ